MPTPTKGPRLGGSPAHERLLLANLATALFEHGRITTTVAKAKRLRPYAESLITKAKRGDLHARRQVLAALPTGGVQEADGLGTRGKHVVAKLFDEIGPRFANRPGGYTRIVKLGPRKGDNAPMAMIELVESLTVAQQAVGEAERARGTTFAGRPAATAPTGAAAAPAGTGTTGAEAAEIEASGPAVEPAGDADAVVEAQQAAEAAPAEGAAEAAPAADTDSGATSQAAAAGETAQAEGDA